MQRVFTGTDRRGSRFTARRAAATLALAFALPMAPALTRTSAAADCTAYWKYCDSTYVQVQWCYRGDPTYGPLYKPLKFTDVDEFVCVGSLKVTSGKNTQCGFSAVQEFGTFRNICFPQTITLANPNYIGGFQGPRLRLIVNGDNAHPIMCQP